MKRVKHLLPLLVLSLAACGGGSKDAGPLCGDGTSLVGLECVPTVRCGFNTYLSGLYCVSDIDYSCAEDTVEEDGVCVVEPNPECGAGTHMVDDICVPEVQRACGPGTYDEDGLCIVADPRACGEGTRADGVFCVPDPKCGEGTVLVGHVCVAASEVVNELFDACDIVSTSFCEEVNDCCPAYNPWDDTLGLNNRLRDLELCKVLVRNSCRERTLNWMLWIENEEVAPAEDFLSALMEYYQVQSCNFPADLMQVIIDGPPDDGTLISPLLDTGNACSRNENCVPPLSCVTSTAGISGCRVPGGDGIRCDPEDHEDCQEGLFCWRNDSHTPASHACRNYLELEEMGCHEHLLCNPAEAFCLELYDEEAADFVTQCMSLLEEGDTCQGGNECAADLYCRFPAGTSQNGICHEFSTLGVACNPRTNLFCAEGLDCSDSDICVNTVSVCRIGREVQ